MASTITGYKEISDQLKRMGKSAGGKALRAAVSSAMLPALQAARAAAPVGDPPYHEGSGVRRNADGTTTYGSGTVRTIDPYPRKTYLGRRVTPGFSKRSVALKSQLVDNGTRARAMVGVKPEAFTALQFVELGTSKMAKRPWLEPSFRASLPAVDARLQEQLKKQIDRAVSGEGGDPPFGGDDQ